MKKSLMTLALATTAVVGLSGCVIAVDGDGDYSHDYSESWKKTERLNREAIADLSIGLTYQSVKNRMGTPDFNEVFQKEGKDVQVLFYRTQHRKSDGITTKDECTALIFEDGELKSWGDRALKDLKNNYN